MYEGVRVHVKMCAGGARARAVDFREQAEQGSAKVRERVWYALQCVALHAEAAVKTQQVSQAQEACARPRSFWRAKIGHIYDQLEGYCAEPDQRKDWSCSRHALVLITSARGKRPDSRTEHRAAAENGM